MFRTSRLLAFLSLATAALVVANPSSAQKDKGNGAPPPVVVADDGAGGSVVKGQLLVTLHKGITIDDLKPVFERLGAKFEVMNRVASVNRYTLTTDHDRLPELKQRLENHPFVASAAFNRVTDVSRVFNDPVFKKPKDMAEDKDNWNLYRINLPDAWDVTTGGTIVAVIDTGAVLEHEELSGRTTEPYSFATGSDTFQDGVKKLKRGNMKYTSEEVRNHGTHVAITIGGRADNDAGTVGVAPNSKLMPLQALYYRERFPDEQAGEVRGTDADITAAMAMAMDRQASVINMSLGGVDQGLLKAWREAKDDLDRADIGAQFLARADDQLKGLAPFLDRANRTGVVVVVAAGNDEIPAEFGVYGYSRRVICVAATTRDDKRAKFSNYGAFTTVSAPGKDIWSGFAEKDKPYTYLSGTSMACPHAAGVVSLMQTVNPDIRLPDAAAILITTGKQLDTDQPVGPLINARRALDETRRRMAEKVREPELPPLIPTPPENPTRPELPADPGPILRQPDPWNNPDVQRIIRVWLTFANPRPPAGGDANVRWFFNLNGQVVNNRTLLTTPRPVWFRFNYRWLWENRGQLDSTNMGTLNEFTVGTLRSGKFDPAATRVAEKFRPGEKDPKPPAGGTPFDPNLNKTKWTGTNGKGEKVAIDFGPDRKAALTRGDKTTPYKVRINTYATPMTLDLFPDKGDPIRCLLHMNDLGEFALRTDFTNVLPKALKPNDADTFKVKRTDLVQVAVGGKRGFTEGDGKRVDARFADAIITDGTKLCAAEVAAFAGSTDSAGPNSAIASKKLNAAIPVVGHHWVIREFKDAKGPKEYIAKMGKDPRFTVKSFDVGTAGFIVVARDIAGDHIIDTVESYAKAGKPFEQSSHMYTLIYRERFLITFSLWEGKRGHDFKAESKKIAEESKKLIDERFPDK